MISKRDIELGKLAVQNGFLTKEQLEKCLDELRAIHLRKGKGPSLSQFLVEKKLLTPRVASSLELANRRLERDREKEEYRVKGYELIRKIGEGGLGVVFKARQISMNRIVALKILHKNWVEDKEFRKRFLVEARAAGKLSHQNLIKVFDVGREGWKYYFSMEYVDGETVEERIARQGKIPPLETVEIALQVLRALRYIASRDIVHCDIKPGNILITKEGVAKLGDFGFLQTKFRIEPAQEGTVLGTPDYIAPEQAMGKKVDFRSDLYSLGVTMYQMLTGELPYQGSISQVIEKHIHATPPPLREKCPEVPSALESIVQKLMEKRPEDRYQSFEELFEDLEEVKSQLTGEAGSLEKRSKKTLLELFRLERERGKRIHLTKQELEQRLLLYQKLLLVLLGYSAVVTILLLFWMI